MNISNLYTFSSIVGNQNSTKKFNNNPNMTLAKDTVSFKGKTVEDFKKMDPSGNYNVSADDVSALLRYFGWEQLKSKSTDHKQWESPYGQTITRDDHGKNEDPKSVYRIIKALQYVDERGGELVVLRQEQTADSRLEEFKTAARTKKPLRENKYAKDYAHQITPLEDFINPKNVDKAKEAQAAKEKTRKNNEQRALIDNYLKAMTEYEQVFLEQKESYKKDLKEAKNNKILLSNEFVASSRELMSVLDKAFKEIKEMLSGYAADLKKGFILSDEEIKDLATKKELIEQDYKSFIEKNDMLSECVLEQLSEKDVLFKRIEALYEPVYSKIAQTQAYIDGLNTHYENQKIYCSLPAAKLDLFKEYLEAAQDKLALIVKCADNAFELDKETTNVINISAALRNLQKIQEEIANEEEFVKLKEFYNKEVLPVETGMLTSEKQRRGSRIDLFNNRKSKAVDLPKDGKKIAPTSAFKEKTLEIINEAELTQEETQLPQTETQEVVDNFVEQVPSTQSAKKVKKNPIERFKESLSRKICLIPLPAALSAYEKLIEEKVNVDDLSAKASHIGAKVYLDGVINSLAKSEDNQRIKNATRFALLNSVYQNSSDKNEAIFSLDSKASQKLYELGLNFPEFEIEKDGESLKINFENGIPVDDINKLFEKYNTKIQDLDNEVSCAILDEISKYLPEDVSYEEMDNINDYLEEQGAFFELLTDENCPANLKETLLKLFFDGFDSKYGSDFSSNAIEIYQKEMKELQEEKSLQEKMDLVDSIDWSF